MVRKSRPTPLKELQVVVQGDQSCRYLALDTHPSSLSPAYPFGPSLQQDNWPWQVGASGCCWNESLGSHDGTRLDPIRSFTPPVSPPALSPRAQDAERTSKRSGRTFALIPVQVDGKHVFTHVVVNPRGSDVNQDPHSIPSEENGLPEDMQDVLRQLDDLASWVKAASSSMDCSTMSITHATCLPGAPGSGTGEHSTRDLNNGPLPDKGKNRLLSLSPSSECHIRQDLVDPSRSAIPAIKSPAADCRLDGFIYVPDCNTPEFLVGSSNSPIAYPVCGYSSHPSRHSPDITRDILYHRRFLERRSAPCPSPTSPLISPSLGKTSFKALFQRSRCNTSAIARPSVPSGHVPVGNALRQGKRMRLPWLRI